MATFTEGSGWEERLKLDGVGVYYKGPDGKIYDDPPEDFVPPYVPQGEPLCHAGWVEKEGLDGKYYVDESQVPHKIVKERPFRFGATYAPAHAPAHAPAPAPAPAPAHAPAPAPAPAPAAVSEPIDPDHVDSDHYKRPCITGWILNAPTFNHQQRVMTYDKNKKHIDAGETYATSHPDEVEKWWNRAVELKAEGTDFHKWGPHPGQKWFQEPPKP